MADIYANTWSETDDDNNSASPAGAPEGMAPSGLNDAIRMVMGAVKRLLSQFIPKTTAGTNTAYTLSYSVAPAALVDGMTFMVRFNQACGLAPTLNVNSLGATPLHKYVGGAWTALAATDVLPGQIVRVTYDSTSGAFRCLVPLGTAAQYNVGTGANNVVQLDANGLLPAGLGVWSTGDVRITTRATAATGWLLLDDGTIGDSSSGATHTGTDYQNLYTALWSAISSPSSNAWCAVTGGLGASAAADWAAHKKMALPKVLGRALAVAGTGTASDATAHALGSVTGTETHTLTVQQMPSHQHDGTQWGGGAGSGGGSTIGTANGSTTTGSTGGGQAHPNMQPTAFLNAEIKL